MLNVINTVIFLAAIGAVPAEKESKRDLPLITAEIRMLKPRPAAPENAEESKTRLRLARAVDEFEKLVSHIAVKRLPLRKTNFAAMWRRMGSEEGRSVVYPELLMQILEMPEAELVKRVSEIGLLVEVPPTSHGCCAIEGYFKFDHEKIKDMPDEIVIALRVRTQVANTKAERGLHHGIMIEMVDRGYYDSYQGYRCADNKATGCRVR